MKPTFRVVIALVHTGSRLASGDCGTKISVLAAPPSAGLASGAANAEAAPSSRLRRFIGTLPSGLADVPEHHGGPLQDALHIVPPRGTLAVAAERNERQVGERPKLILAFQPHLLLPLRRAQPRLIQVLGLRIGWPAEPSILAVAANEVGQQRVAIIRRRDNR